jgi:predicted O-methyltransferase YrrM
MRTIIKKLLQRFGYELVRPARFDGSLDPCNSILKDKKIVDLERLVSISLSIPGMVTPQSGQMLYSLCVMQGVPGDVVEIGSWQGRSTSFLARAASESKNGRFFAIDHFRGNAGKEESYVVGKEDLSDLKNNFLENMRKLGLESEVNLMDMPNSEAAIHFHPNQIRFLFIDGDHTAEGVSRDIELFFPKLCSGAIVVFDDFSNAFPGLLDVLDNLLKSKAITQRLSYKNTLVIRL